MDVVSGRLFLSFCVLVLIVGTASADNCYNTTACRERFQATHNKCEGIYCGRPLSVKMDSDTGIPFTGDIATDKCDACAWGCVSDGWACNLCSTPGVHHPYHVCYLIAVVFMTLYIQLLHMDKTLPSAQAKHRPVLLLVVILEYAVASLLTVLLFPPTGGLSLFFCSRIADIPFVDWYTALRIPTHHYCVSEVVFPLFTFPLAHMGLLVLLLLAVRVPVSACYADHGGKRSIYLSLLGLPVLAFAHLFLGAVVYYAFPYVILCVGLFSETSVLVRKGKDMVTRKLTDVDVLRPRIKYLVKYLSTSFALVSLMEYAEYPREPLYFVIAGAFPIIPTLVLLLTWKFTAPRAMHLD